MLKAEIELVREICREEIKLALGETASLAKKIAKEAAAEAIKEAKRAADAKNANAKQSTKDDAKSETIEKAKK